MMLLKTEWVFFIPVTRTFSNTSLLSFKLFFIANTQGQKGKRTLCPMLPITYSSYHIYFAASC